MNIPQANINRFQLNSMFREKCFDAVSVYCPPSSNLSK